MDNSDQRFIDMLSDAVRDGYSFIALPGPLDASDPRSVKAHLLNGGAMYNTLTGDTVISDDNGNGVLYGFMLCKVSPDAARKAWEDEGLEPAQLALGTVPAPGTLAYGRMYERPPAAIDELATMCSGDGWIDGYGPLPPDRPDAHEGER